MSTGSPSALAAHDLWCDGFCSGPIFPTWENISAQKNVVSLICQTIRKPLWTEVLCFALSSTTEDDISVPPVKLSAIFHLEFNTEST